MQPIRPAPLVSRHFTRAGADPLDQVVWERRDARISSPSGQVVFEQLQVEVPAAWSTIATNVVVSKYFRGQLGTPGRETSIRQPISRVVATLARWGREQGYWADEQEEQSFADELTHLLVRQMASFNSPVWFNVGVEAHPQCSACFILSIRDSMNSILELARTEGTIFKWGSGAGTNLSALRGSMEPLTGGGTASGPVSFMRGFDAFAGVIKSGGKTRRAAKMVMLDVGHPDILDFVRCKAHEEKKAHALIEAGYSANFNEQGGAYETIAYQNANHSVRVTDEFMRAVAEDRDWELHGVTTGQVLSTIRARELFREMAQAAWVCGDPGIQYDTTINRWNTCSRTDRIRASNPCSEFMFLDNSACNLASLNLLAFQQPDGTFDTEGFRHAVRVLITAQDIMVDRASYPTPQITENSRRFRPLGLGYANLGALLMSLGLPYDSEQGRAHAAALTALMHGEALLASQALAERRGPFAGFEENRGEYFRVVRQHGHALDRIDTALVPDRLFGQLGSIWSQLLTRVEQQAPFRNAQVTLLAPTGTIGFMMDCDTTGIEPELSLVRYKTLVGGGQIKLVNRVVPAALERLGYQAEEIRSILAQLEAQGTLEGASGLDPAHLPVFDCALKPTQGARSIEPMGHLRMMAAVQPFLSGAISKTVNIPHESTPEEIERIYLDGWKLGLKAVAIYRDGCKKTQPISTSPAVGGKREEDREDAQPAALVVNLAPVSSRRLLPNERASITHKFEVGGHSGYVTVGMYPDGQPGEIFVVMAKQGSTIGGLMDAFATAISIALQYRVPLADLIRKFSHVRFEPSGFTGNPDIPFAKSIVDYIFRWMALRFGVQEGEIAQTELPLEVPAAALATEGPVRTLAPGAPSAFPEFTAWTRIFEKTGGGATMADEQPPEHPNEADGPTEAGRTITANLRSLTPVQALPGTAARAQADAPLCPECGYLTVRNGACYKCLNCGASLGCS